MGMDGIYRNNIWTIGQNIWDRLKEHHVRDTWELQDQHQKHLAKTWGTSRNTFERNFMVYN
jgi:hypothetical protein